MMNDHYSKMKDTIGLRDNIKDFDDEEKVDVVLNKLRKISKTVEKKPRGKSGVKR